MAAGLGEAGLTMRGNAMVPGSSVLGLIRE